MCGKNIFTREKILQENFANVINSCMERVSGTAGQKALALQQLGKDGLQNLCTSICVIIMQLISLITNNSRLFMLKSRVLFL